MNPTSRSRPVWVGLFVLGATVIVAGAVLTIGDLRQTLTPRIDSTAVFDEVNGLQAGDNIWYSGLKVGIVKGLSFNDESRILVDMRIDVAATTHIRRDALAKIGSDGLIGSTIVVLYGGSEAASTLRDGDVLASGTSVSTGDVMDLLMENGTNILAITADLKEVSRRLAAGEGSVGQLLKDDTLYAGVAASASSLSTTADAAATLTADLAHLSRKVQAKGGLVDGLVSDRTILPAVQASMADLQRASRGVNSLVEGVSRGAADTSTPVGALLHDEASGEAIKATLQQFRVGSVLLAEDLEAVQHNFLLRGFFAKRERAEAAKAREAEREAQESE